MKRIDQQGFSVFEFVVIAGVLSIISLAGWNIYHRSHQNGSVTTQRVAKSNSIPVVSSASDLDKASQSLDQLPDSSSDAAQLDQDLGSF